MVAISNGAISEECLTFSPDLTKLLILNPLKNSGFFIKRLLAMGIPFNLFPFCFINQFLHLGRAYKWRTSPIVGTVTLPTFITALCVSPLIIERPLPIFLAMSEYPGNNFGIENSSSSTRYGVLSAPNSWIHLLFNRLSLPIVFTIVEVYAT